MSGAGSGETRGISRDAVWGGPGLPGPWGGVPAGAGLGLVSRVWSRAARDPVSPSPDSDSGPSRRHPRQTGSKSGPHLAGDTPGGGRTGTCRHSDASGAWDRHHQTFPSFRFCFCEMGIVNSALRSRWDGLRGKGQRVIPGRARGKPKKCEVAC